MSERKGVGMYWNTKFTADEEANLELLQGRLKHLCPDWDFLAIDEFCPEIEGCACNLPMQGELV